MQRVLQAELLDSLPPDHPAALHNRRDLRVINRCMGNYRWFARTLSHFSDREKAALELGAGDGTLGLELNRRGLPVDGLDLWPRPPAWPPVRAWHRADLRTFPEYGRYPIVVGNLIFHQFNEAELGELGATLRRQARTIVACEPARRRLSQALLAVFGPLLGANAITRHDARVSVAAGFRGDELPRALGLNPADWKISCDETALGAYRMVAIRRG